MQPVRREEVHYDNIIKNYGGNEENDGNDRKEAIERGQVAIGDLRNFTGGFINFGYYSEENLDEEKELKESDRTEASKRLYHNTIMPLGIKQRDKLMEGACGTGIGFATVLFPNYQFKHITLVDVTPAQIEKAKTNIRQHNIPPDKVRFVVSAMEDVALPASSLDKFFSVEAIQHVPSASLNRLAKKLNEIIKKRGQGMVSISGHFAKDQRSLEAMRRQNLLVGEKVDVLNPIGDVIKAFKDNGFQVEPPENAALEYRDVSSQVFPGYEKWLNQIQLATQWSHNIYKSYQKGYLIYAILVFRTLHRSAKRRATAALSANKHLFYGKKTVSRRYQSRARAARRAAPRRYRQSNRYATRSSKAAKLHR